MYVAVVKKFDALYIWKWPLGRFRKHLSYFDRLVVHSKSSKFVSKFDVAENEHTQWKNWYDSCENNEAIIGIE